MATGRASHVRQVKGDVFQAGLGVGHEADNLSPQKKSICREASKIGNQMDKTKMTQHEQGFKSGEYGTS